MTEEQLDKKSDLILKTLMDVLTNVSDEQREAVEVLARMVTAACEPFVENEH